MLRRLGQQPEIPSQDQSDWREHNEGSQKDPDAVVDQQKEAPSISCPEVSNPRTHQ
jgi:hypothetical protein